MTDVILTVAGRPLTVFGVGCAFAMLCLLVRLRQGMRQRGLETGAFLRAAVLMPPLALLMARLMYVLPDFAAGLADSSYYLTTLGNPALALRFWDGGYSLIGAMLGCIWAARLAERWTQAPAAAIRDSLATALPLAIAVERLFERGTGLGVGRELTWAFLRPIAVWQEDVPMHPVYLYEAAVAVLLFLWMLIRENRVRANDRPGDGLRVFLTLFGLTQVLLESLRADGHMVLHFVHVQQVLAIALVIGCMIAWSRLAAKKKPGFVAVAWILNVLAVGAAVVAEFGVDRWGEPLLAYGIMAACMLLIGCLAFGLKRRAAEN